MRALTWHSTDGPGDLRYWSTNTYPYRVYYVHELACGGWIRRTLDGEYNQIGLERFETREEAIDVA